MIRGTREPQFETTGGTKIVLDYATILVNEPLFRTIEQESVLTNYINHIHLGVHWMFQVRINLYKHGANTAITKYLQLASYLGSDVYLYEHKEGNAFQDSSGNKILFRVQEVKPSYFETADFKDVIYMTFKSSKPIDISKMVLDENAIFTEKYGGLYPLTDDSGNVQVYEEGEE